MSILFLSFQQLAHLLCMRRLVSAPLTECHMTFDVLGRVLWFLIGPCSIFVFLAYRSYQIEGISRSSPGNAHTVNGQSVVRRGTFPRARSSCFSLGQHRLVDRSAPARLVRAVEMVSRRDAR